MKFPKDFINKIICGDPLEVIKEMPDKCVDLVVTSPPYNLKNSTGNGMIEICNHCGCDVSWGSGNFVNRIPDFNDILIRIDNLLLYPLGDFVCEGCDNNSLTDND